MSLKEEGWKIIEGAFQPYRCEAFPLPEDGGRNFKFQVFDHDDGKILDSGEYAIFHSDSLEIDRILSGIITRAREKLKVDGYALYYSWKYPRAS